jgi:hypothetical protein
MLFNIQIAALIGALATSVAAADVYSTFYTRAGDQVGAVNYDVGNDACFQNSGADYIVFSQGGCLTCGTADGPYCLQTYKTNDCRSGGVVGSQTFKDVTFGTKYRLDDKGVANGPFHFWSTKAC